MEPSFDRRARRPFPISKLFPNMVTLAALCSGLTALRFALHERWEFAVGFIIVAAILDGMDGRIARLLGSTSTFGAQLDSLSDFVCFGVSPALILYMWTLHEVRAAGWGVALFFTVCCALRLARFNTSMVEGPKEPWRGGFFTGVPAPAGAILALLPMVASFQMNSLIFAHAWFNITYVGVIAALMASRIPTFSGKTMRIRHDMIVPVMLFAAFFITSLIIESWATILVSGLLYLALIPISVSRFQAAKRGYVAEEAL